MLNLLDEFVTGWVDDPLAGFAVGTFGAIAEFLRPPGATVTVEHRPGRHTAVCDEGALRLDLHHGTLSPRAWRRPVGTDDWTHAVALCLPGDRAAGPGRTAVTVLGDDPDPLVAPGTLVDLGLGVGHLEPCVRTTDRALIERCEQAAALDGELVGAIVASGATRVFRTAVARIEVCTPIPPPDGESPLGPHTHLLPDLLAHRRTHAATDPIPDVEVPVASVFPPHPLRDALGRAHPYDPDADAAFEAVLEAFGDPDELVATRDARAGGPAPAVMNAAQRRGRRVGGALRATDETGS
ncbi:DUF6925 family protein [Actinomycetospora termitidis]|uniref:Uncharacterized protein n=1 Tax=Actinomycetospora termitidis TaxID=3053470 RepID=A0ABT7M7Q8_9PSEU|nr:hypothetical protein [Actinomycetospora sp. Odt1-22]MDL5156476.1 hypothetical protein [Actinomycetospora sp. Odt1-22]